MNSRRSREKVTGGNFNRFQRQREENHARSFKKYPKVCGSLGWNSRRKLPEISEISCRNYRRIFGGRDSCRKFVKIDLRIRWRSPSRNLRNTFSGNSGRNSGDLLQRSPGEVPRGTPKQTAERFLEKFFTFSNPEHDSTLEMVISLPRTNML